nr:hypothetical protein [Streptomyces sp. GbtcB6]
MGDGEDRYAGEADQEARDAPYAQVLPFAAEVARRHHAHDRYARYQEARRRAGQVAFRVGQGEPRAHDLYAREGQHRAPVGADGEEQAALADRQWEEEQRAYRAAGENHH